MQPQQQWQPRIDGSSAGGVSSSNKALHLAAAPLKLHRKNQSSSSSYGLLRLAVMVAATSHSSMQSWQQQQCTIASNGTPQIKPPQIAAHSSTLP